MDAPTNRADFWDNSDDLDEYVYRPYNNYRYNMYDNLDSEVQSVGTVTKTLLVKRNHVFMMYSVLKSSISALAFMSVLTLMTFTVHI